MRLDNQGERQQHLMHPWLPFTGPTTKAILHSSLGRIIADF